ncbi:DinB family protein [bacterium]|nr:DinB family protein [bacterium]
MHTPDSLIDLHVRCHRSLAKLFRHCRKLDNELARRELDGFGFPDLHAQLFHIVDVEDWWMGGVSLMSRGGSKAEDFADIRALDEWRKEVAQRTQSYLERASRKELNEKHVLRCGGEKGPKLVPAFVLMHVVTHAYHHKGQASAMCRLLGHPAPETDLPMKGRSHR